MKSLIFTFCVLYNLLPFAILSNETPGDGYEQNKNPNTAISEDVNTNDVKNNTQYQKEIEAGDLADSFSTNIHKYVPQNYPDFSRRFVPIYPYYEKTKEESKDDDAAEEIFDNAIKKILAERHDSTSSSDSEEANSEEERLRPVKAPPLIVLAIAEQSALLEKAKPHKSTFLDGNALRNGEYWDAFWKEEVDPTKEKSLRSSTPKRAKNFESIRVKIMPGSRLYKLVSLIKNKSPELLYIMTK